MPASPAVLLTLPVAAAALKARKRLAAERHAMERPHWKSWTPECYQRVPPLDGPWRYWALVGGRGTGKTDAGAYATNQHALGPPCAPHFPGGHRISIVAPTLGDAVDSCVNGLSGLKMHNPEIRLVQGVGGAHVRWPNGAEARLFGAYTPEDVERFRAGGNRCFVWAEELAAWPKLDDVWAQMEMGLRIGPAPRVAITTTPRPVKVLKQLLADPLTVEARTEDGRRPTTDDNPYLPAEVRARLMARYAGTRLGRQELLGEVLDDLPGALWHRQRLDDLRVSTAPDLQRVVVAIDPAMTSGEDADETGIVVAAKGVDGQGYVLADRTCRLSPDGWARRALTALDDFDGDRIVAEVNNGGEMVEHTIRTVRRNAAYKAVHASRGKRVRAEPVAALYEQGKVHHAGTFAELEDQMCAFTPDGYDGSPDRVDALVWALTELMLDGQWDWGGVA